MNKEFIRMQKLAGLMTEGLYTSDEKAPMEGMSTGKMTKKELKAKIKEMMAPMPEDDDTRIDYSMGKTGPNQMPKPPKSLNIDIDEEVGRGRMYFHVLENGGYGRIGHQGVYDTKEDAEKRADTLSDKFPKSEFYVEAYPSKKEPVTVTMEGEMAYAGMGSLDEDHTMDAYQIARELVRKMPFPDAVFASKDLFLATIDALHDELYSYAEDQFGDAGSAPDEDDNYDDSMDVYDPEYPNMAEGDLFEAKEDEESDTEDVIVAEPGEEEVPAEDVAVDVGDSDTQVDVNMDGVPDVDTGSPESKKAFTSAVDAYNDGKALGDPKYTQILANALTYYNKNIILKAGRPQA